MNGTRDKIIEVLAKKPAGLGFGELLVETDYRKSVDYFEGVLNGLRKDRLVYLFDKRFYHIKYRNKLPSKLVAGDRG